MKSLTLKTALVALSLLIVSSVLALAIVEGAVRWRINYERDFTYAGDTFWELRFLEARRAGTSRISQHAPHPTRGWTPLPNTRIGEETVVTTNNRGHRSLIDYTYQPDKFTIVALGDSFTWGGEVGDADVWPTLLQEKDPRFHVINLGVNGYGVDQMYITLRETIDDYRPQLAILAFGGEDVNRTMLSFRDYRKPLFTLSADGQLGLTNTPIGDEDDTFAYVKRRLGFPRLMSVLMLKDRALLLRLQTPAYDRQRYDLNAAIVKEAMHCAETHHAEFLLLNLVCGPGISSPNMPPDPSERFFETFIRENPVPALATRKPFLDAGKQWYQGHYLRPEALFLVDLLYAKIQTLTSWQEYLARHKSP